MLTSKNPGVWRTAKTGALPTFEYSGSPTAKVVDGKLDKSLVTVANGQRRKRFKREEVAPSKYVAKKHRHSKQNVRVIAQRG